MYDDDLLSLTPEQLVVACRKEGILWLVIVKPKAAHVDEPILKLKSVLRGSEEEGSSPSPPPKSTNESSLIVKRSELVLFVKHELLKQSTIDTALAVVPEPVPVEPTFQPYDASKPRQDYFALIADDDVRHKGKHKQRTMIIQRGTSLPLPSSLEPN